MFKSNKTKKQIACYHERAIGIYGDGINIANGNRAWCSECKTLLPSLPPKERQ